MINEIVEKSKVIPEHHKQGFIQLWQKRRKSIWTGRQRRLSVIPKSVAMKFFDGNFNRIEYTLIESYDWDYVWHTTKGYFVNIEVVEAIYMTIRDKDSLERLY
jgi:hypothetical protein